MKDSGVSGVGARVARFENTAQAKEKAHLARTPRQERGPGVRGNSLGQDRLNRAGKVWQEYDDTGDVQDPCYWRTARPNLNGTVNFNGIQRWM